MKRPSLAIAVAASALVMSAGLAACGDDDDETDTGGGGGGAATLDLTIGDSVPLTGDLSPFGPPGQKAADVAVAEINAAIEEVGADHTVNIVHEDNGGGADQQAAVQAARKMVQSDGATCIAGAWASSDTIPTSESVTIPEEVLLISPSSTSDDITDLDDNGLTARTSPPDKYQGPTLADAIAADLGGANGRTVNIGARNDSYGTGLAGTFREAWEGLGGRVGEEVVYDTTLASYDSEAQQITSGNPDRIVIIDFPETFAKVGPALERTGNWDPKAAWGTDGLTIGPLPTPPSVSNGMQVTAPGSPDGGEAPTAFADLFAQSPPGDVEQAIFAAQNFDAVILCYLAAVAAGSTEGADMAEVVGDISGPPGDKYTFEQLPEAIRALQNGDEIDYEGAGGAIDLDEAGDPTAGVYDINVFNEQGELEVIDEVPVTTP